MKILKTLFCLLTVIAVLSCEKNDEFEADSLDARMEDNKVLRYDFTVDLETATYAASFLDTTTLVSIEPVVYNSCDTVAYVVNYENGWKLLSADMRATPVLVSSPKGHYDVNVQNPGMKFWIEKLLNDVLVLKHDKRGISYAELNKDENYQFWNNMYLSAIALKSSSNIRRSAKSMALNNGNSKNYVSYKYLCKRLVSTKLVSTTEHLVNERLKTKWGQGEPWNMYAPTVYNNAGEDMLPPVGCVAVAMGQLLYFTHYKLGVPSGLYHGAHYVGNFSEKKYEPGVYNANSTRWDDMSMEYGDYGNFAYVAEFLAELGHQHNMTYTAAASSAQLSLDVCRKYGLTWDVSSYNYVKIVDNLEKGMPVLMSAYRDKTTTGWWFWEHDNFYGGHAWIIDGLLERSVTTLKKYEWEIVEYREYLGEREENNGVRNETNKPGHGNGTSKFDLLTPISQDECPKAIYYSMEQMRKDYESIVDYDNALRQGISEGQTESKQSIETNRSFLMNWGWYGDFNDLTYALNASKWSAGNKTYQYNAKIYYNIRVK